MFVRLHSFIRRCVLLTRVSASLVAALTLLTFALPHAHQSTNHFRTPEVRNSIERHTFLNETRSDCSSRIGIEQDLLSPLLLTTVEDRMAKLETQRPVILPRASRLLARLKLGPRSDSSGSDPLI